ncbi:MAG: glycosyltransferase family 4 protein [Ginsengibacter sp.]
MRIAFITYEFPPDTGKGGIGTYTKQVSDILAKEKWDVHVFAGSHTRQEKNVEEGLTVHRIKCTSPHDFKLNVLQVFSDIQTVQAFDILESPEINGNAGEIKIKYPQIPLVVRLHAPGYLVESLKKTYVPFLAKLRYVLGSLRTLRFDLGYWRAYNKLNDADYHFTRMADYITAPSEAMKDWVIKNWQLPANKIVVLPNIFEPAQEMLDVPIFRECKHKRILFFGRLNVLKGLVNATRAMKKILKAYPDWTFRVIGDDGPGPNFKMTMRAWMTWQLEYVIKQVEFMDGLPYEDLPAAVADCEIVLLPSLFESFSYTCAEAMAAGKAVVGSNNAGMADLLQNGKSGVLINPYGYKEIVRALKELIENNSYRYELSSGARKRITTAFDAEKTALKFNMFYEKIVDK